MLEGVPDADLDACRSLHGGAHPHTDDLALVLPPLGERLEHGEAGGTHFAGLPAQNIRARGLEPAVEFVEPHVVVSEWPPLLVEIDPEHEDGVDQLRVAEVIPAEVVLRSHRIDPRRTGTGGPAAESDTQDLSREAAFHELGPRRRPPVETGIVERALLEACSLGAYLTKVRAVELAGRERAPRPSDEERRELLVEPQAAEIAGHEVADGELELVEARLAEVDVRESGAPHRDDAGLNVVRLRFAVVLGHCARGSAVRRARASALSASRALCRSRRGSCRSRRAARPLAGPRGTCRRSFPSGRSPPCPPRRRSRRRRPSPRPGRSPRSPAPPPSPARAGHPAALRRPSRAG